MLWQFGQAILDYGKPEAMKAMHQSNIFCLGITSDSKKIYSGGNDDIVSIIQIKHTFTVLYSIYNKIYDKLHIYICENLE